MAAVSDQVPIHECKPSVRMTTIRRAIRPDVPAIMNILDGALLAVSAATIRERIRANETLVAVADDRVLGACVLDSSTQPTLIVGVAVRPRRRNSGIGSALLQRARHEFGPLTAEFDAAVHPFYVSLGFDITPIADGRYRGTWDTSCSGLHDEGATSID